MKNKDAQSVREFYDKKAEDYDKSYETPYWRLYHEITWHNIRRFLPRKRNAIVLDAGGGTGYWAIRLGRLGHDVVLTDISWNMLKVAKEKIRQEELQSKIESVIANIRDMSCFPSNYFHLVLAEGDPVSYCLDAEKAIRELARVAGPNAHVIVSVDSKYRMIPTLIEEGSPAELRKFLSNGILKREFTFQAFTPEELCGLFDASGLKVVRMIGKPILTQFVSREKRDEIIQENFKELLELELRFCDTPSLVGIGGHLEIVGLKQKRDADPS